MSKVIYFAWPGTIWVPDQYLVSGLNALVIGVIRPQDPSGSLICLVPLVVRVPLALGSAHGS